MKKVLLTILILIVARLAVAAEEKTKAGASEENKGAAASPVKYQLLALEVIKALPETTMENDSLPDTTAENKHKLHRSHNLGFFIRPAKTELQILISDPKRHFIGFDQPSSRIVRFADNRGDLREGGNGRSGSIDSYPHEISVDGHHCVIRLSAPHSPAPGTTQIMVEAKIVLRCAKDEKNAEKKNIELAEGGELDFGKVNLDVSEGKQNHGLFGFGAAKPPQTAVKISSSSPMDVIKEIEFFSTDGKKLNYQNTMSSSMGFGSQMTYTKEFALEEKVKKLNVKVTYFDKVESIAVPIKLETGLGL
jgi:hypothetical protein